MASERLLNAHQAILRWLRDPSHSLPARLYSISEQCSWMRHLLESGRHGTLPDAALSALQDELAAGLLAAIEEDPHVREDETWGNTGALLDWLSAHTHRPWRPPEPTPRALLAELVAIHDAHPDWPRRIALLEAHPVLGNYNRAAELFRRLDGDDSAEVAAAMKRLKAIFAPRKALPRSSWWTLDAPDWVKDWHRSR